MIRVLLISILTLFSLLPVFAEETVKETYKLQGQIEYDDNPVETIYLDENIEKPQVNIPKRSLTLPVRSLNITSNTNTPRSALARAAVSRNNLKDILPLSGSISETTHGLTYGTIWDEELSYTQMEASTGVFARYDFPKYLSFNATVRQNASQDIGSQYATARFTPEWRITDKLVLKDNYTEYLDLPKTKNEIVIVYTPALKKYAESLKFELGLAESYYNSGKRSTALRFSTGFKL